MLLWTLLFHADTPSLIGNTISAGSTGVSTSSPFFVPLCNLHMPKSLVKTLHMQKFISIALYFTWLADTIVVSDGIHLLDTVEWDANLVTYCNASLQGLGFVAPAMKQGFYGTTPTDGRLQTIFYFEVLRISSAIL